MINKIIRIANTFIHDILNYEKGLINKKSLDSTSLPTFTTVGLVEAILKRTLQ